MTRKKREAIATTRLNAYVSEELNRPEEGSLQQIGHHYEERKVLCVTDSPHFLPLP